nr:retrotransposon protein, putative, Ty1-copia subclass [Tanacetum cinerariifolium]
MMNLTTLSLSFWDYALESATRILNMVPTKKVNKTPYELWYGKVPNLSYLKVWGCEALVKRDTPDKLQQRSVKYLEEIQDEDTSPSEITSEILMKVEGFEPSQEEWAIDLEEIQDEDTSPSEITSEILMKVEGFEPSQEEVILIRRSERIHRAPDRLCLNVEVEEHSLGDLNEPASYKAAMLYSESNKWIDAMNAEIQSMIDNMVWVLVDLPPSCKTVGSKWIFKKKTDMDDIVHTYKAHLVAKGYTQLYGVDYEETFDEEIKRFGFDQNLNEPCVYQKASGSNVTFLILYVDDIIIMGNHIPSLQSVKDYLRKCFAMKDLRKAAFILGIKIYRDRSKRLIGLGQNAYMDKILKRYKMDNSKRGHIPMKERLDLNRTQGASTPKEVKRMQNVPYASVVGSIMYAVRCTRPDVVFAQNITSRFQQNPSEYHWTAVKYILKGAVEWKSSKQSTTAMFATETEYIAASKATMEAVWIRKFISGLGIVPTINEPIRMFCDNSAALHFANEPRVQRGARHYHRRYHYVRESIALGEIRFFNVHTYDNLADPFTKALCNTKLTQHARSTGLRLASSFI